MVGANVSIVAIMAIFARESAQIVGRAPLSFPRHALLSVGQPERTGGATNGFSVHRSGLLMKTRRFNPKTSLLRNNTMLIIVVCPRICGFADLQQDLALMLRLVLECWT